MLRELRRNQFLGDGVDLYYPLGEIYSTLRRFNHLFISRRTNSVHNAVLILRSQHHVCTSDRKLTH